MRKSLILFMAAAVIVALAPQAVAAPGSISFSRYSSITAQAFWFQHQQLSKNTTSDTTWYVGVYGSSSDIYSDLYEDVYTCKVSRKGESCTDAYSEGDTSLTSQNFTIDSKSLSSAHLDAVYPLQAYDENYNPIGGPTQVHVVVDWTGSGDLTKVSDRYGERSGCSLFRFSSRGYYRDASVTGSLDGTALTGDTYAFMATNTETDFERTC